VTAVKDFALRIIGERINPGFKSTRALFDTEDIPGIQALAVRQAEAGAAYQNVNIGARAMTDPEFMTKIITAIQDVVTSPLSFDFPSRKVQEICLAAYRPERAGGALPIVNSITEHRWDLMELYGKYRFKVILMASERMEDGVARGNKTAQQIHGTARRAALRLKNDCAMPLDDIFIDMSVSRTERRAHDGRPVQHRPATAAQGGRRFRPQALPGKRLPHPDRAPRLRYRSGHALARLRTPAGRTPRDAGLPQLPRTKRQQRLARGTQVLQGLSHERRRPGPGGG
jgi:cobalamin-dependent methionine synthase I